MFSKTTDGKIMLEIKGTKYVIDNNDDYKKLVIYLTNPLADGRDVLTMDEMKIDSSLDEDDVRLCEKYKDFIRGFEESRKRIIHKPPESA
jgi:hypothetical protein